MRRSASPSMAPIVTTPAEHLPGWRRELRRSVRGVPAVMDHWTDRREPISLPRAEKRVSNSVAWESRDARMHALLSCVVCVEQPRVRLSPDPWSPFLTDLHAVQGSAGGKTTGHWLPAPARPRVERDHSFDTLQPAAGRCQGARPLIRHQCTAPSAVRPVLMREVLQTRGPQPRYVDLNRRAV